MPGSPELLSTVRWERLPQIEIEVTFGSPMAVALGMPLVFNCAGLLSYFLYAAICGCVPCCARACAHGPWAVDRGPWTVDRGPWTVDRGPRNTWAVDREPWTVDREPQKSY